MIHGFGLKIYQRLRLKFKHTKLKSVGKLAVLFYLLLTNSIICLLKLLHVFSLENVLVSSIRVDIRRDGLLISSSIVPPPHDDVSMLSMLSRREQR